MDNNARRTKTIQIPGVDRRKFLGLMGGTLGGAILAACGGNGGATTTLASTTAGPGTTAAPGATAGPGTTMAGSVPQSNLPLMRVGYDNPSYYHHMTDIVAWEAGYLQEAGFTEFSDIIINDSLAAIVGGGLDMTAADTDAIGGRFAVMRDHVSPSSVLA